ncbi:MAG: ABC transporter [Nitratiruptor sp.]|nr:ABC transporter [Nitratiruptor sp.]NPA83943.1 AarF/ABC1/UbiB kinase family protein [Campylobacterota bacterium]
MRLYVIFRVLLTLFLLIKRRPSFFGLRPYGPEELAERIVQLGTSFIKLAQVLGTRADLFDEAYVAQLQRIHDALPPMDPKELETIYQRSIASIPLEAFEWEPIASASIGQVHVGWLKGTKVAIKIRRYKIQEQVARDIGILRLMLWLFSPLFNHYTKHSLEALILEFGDMVLKEVDFRQELRNLKRFAKSYPGFARYPTPFEAYCNEEVLVMEFMEGVRFDDRKGLQRLGIDFRPLIEQLVRFYAEQMLVRGFFHADPHPGNLLVDRNGELILLDFGMVKQIPNETRVALIELIKAAHERDFELYVSAAKRLGTIAYEAPAGMVAQFVEAMFEIFSDDHLRGVDMQRLAFEVLQSMRDLPFKLPQEAVYILRVSAIIEGLGTHYIDNFNGVKDILPILQRNIPRALGYKERLLDMVLDEIRQGPYVLQDFKETLRLAREGSLKVELSPLQLEWLRRERREWRARVGRALALMLLGLFLLLLDSQLSQLATLLFGIGFGWFWIAVGR